MSKFLDLSGDRFGRLTVIEKAGKSKHGHTMWKCICECGNETIVQTGNLRSGHTRSCGCLEIENKKKIKERGVIKHGATNTRLFNIWQSMLERCNCNGIGLKNYGERGISVCIEWNDYSKFREWAYSAGYDESVPRGQCTIERINVNGNYAPDNCRWATNQEQQNNRRNNFYITFQGKTQSLKMWTDELGLPYRTIIGRLRRLGWNVEDALSTPIGAARGRST